MKDRGAERERMVRDQIAARGVRDPAVLDAMRSVPREAFLPPELGVRLRGHAAPDRGGADDLAALHRRADDRAARLRPGDRVLEIGTGSGYAAAVLGAIAREVYTIERHEELAELARATPARARLCTTSHVRHGDGTLGWPEHAPYDAIVVAAGGPSVPDGAARAARRRRPARHPGRRRDASSRRSCA